MFNKIRGLFSADLPIDLGTANTLVYMREQAANGHPVNLLVSDIEMPGLDGYELTFEVRNSPELAAAYIILHTSLSSSISVGQAHQVGANVALTKFDAKELVLAMMRGVECINEQSEG